MGNGGHTGVIVGMTDSSKEQILAGTHVPTFVSTRPTGSDKSVIGLYIPRTSNLFSSTG